MDSSWRNPSRALAAGLTHPRRFISTWARLGPRPTMRRKVPRIAMLPRSPSSVRISLAVAKDVPSSRPEVAVTRRQRRKGSKVRGRRKQAQRWAARILLPHAPRHPPRRGQGTGGGWAAWRGCRRICLVHTQRQSIDELERRLDGAERGESLLDSLAGGFPAAGLLGTAASTAGAQEPLQHYGQRSFPHSQPAPQSASFQDHGQLLEQPQPDPGGRAHTPQAVHQHLGTLGAKANNEKKGTPDCHAAPEHLFSKNLPRRRQRRPEQQT
ncbi:hypothetical protein P7K49_029612 [Saguinus oedipus]|uniref:Uncharacterized protein n=1 Tax=Saguinus oedipus TaxID=9490 RepID=A0ABQ9U8X9_SAGOE|nr:hypothetical protein P7K49_029612 [Saguinus oedipus]